MIEVEFNYQQNTIIMQSNLNDSFETIIRNYTIKANLDINNIFFISNGQIINKEDKLENIMSQSNKINKKIVILVYSIFSNIINENTNIKISNDIICPRCKEICKYEINDYKIKLFDCKNGHIMDDIKLDKFKFKQFIDISQIKCDNCEEKNKSDTFNNEMYICYECKINLCPLCKSIHNKNHSFINYDNKNYICNKHNELYIEYCEDCNKDICLSCSSDHENHKTISYKEKLINIKNIRNKMNEFEKVINKLKLNLEEIINKFRKIIDNFVNIYNINNNILNNYEKNKNRNYILLLNLNYMNKYIDDEISIIKNKYNYGNNLNQILNIYNVMINDKKDEIEIIYKPKNKGKIKIFGSQFVYYNKDNSKII